MIRLHYHKTYKKSLRKLDNQSIGLIQKAVMDFEDQGNSVSLNLEKLYACNFWSIRASKELRIILCPIQKKDQKDWLLVHADHHDKAYEWANNKNLTYTEATQTYDIIQVSGEELTLAEPAFDYQSTYTGRFTNWTDGQIQAIGIPTSLIEFTRKLSSEHQIKELKNFIPEITYEALHFAFMGESPEEVIRLVEAGKIDSARASTEEILHSPNNQQNIVQFKGTSEIERFYHGDFADWMLFLHPTQRILAEGNFNGPVKVTGGAGTGKTVVALHRAKYLQTHKQDARPIFFTTFNRNLAENLESQFQALGLSPHQIILKNIHRFLLETAKQDGLLPGSVKIVEFSETNPREIWQEILSAQAAQHYTLEFLMDEWVEVIMYYDLSTLAEYTAVSRSGRKTRIYASQREEIWRLMKSYNAILKERNLVHLDQVANALARYFASHPEKRPYSHIIVDEVQDFGMPELRLIRQLVDEGKNDLFLCGDPMQKIYTKRFHFSHVGISVKGQRSKKLTINYRTTEQIRRQAVCVIQEVDFDDFDGKSVQKKGYQSLFVGQEPEYQLFDREETEIDFILLKIQYLYETHQILPEEICVGAFRNQTLKSVIKSMHKAGFPYYDLRDSKGDKEGVHISSFHKMKGMEYRVVFLMGLSQKTLPYKFRGYNFMSAEKQQQAIKSQKALIYVAMTRARDLLYMTGIGKQSEWLCG